MYKGFIGCKLKLVLGLDWIGPITHYICCGHLD